LTVRFKKVSSFKQHDGRYQNVTYRTRLGHRHPYKECQVNLSTRAVRQRAASAGVSKISPEKCVHSCSWVFLPRALGRCHDGLASRAPRARGCAMGIIVASYLLAGVSGDCNHLLRYDGFLYLLLFRPGGAGVQGPKGGTSKQTSAGVDIRKLEDDDSDAPMKLPTASRELRVALSQARTVSPQVSSPPSTALLAFILLSMSFSKQEISRTHTCTRTEHKLKVIQLTSTSHRRRVSRRKISQPSS